MANYTAAHQSSVRLGNMYDTLGTSSSPMVGIYGIYLRYKPQVYDAVKSGSMTRVHSILSSMRGDIWRLLNDYIGGVLLESRTYADVLLKDYGHHLAVLDDSRRNRTRILTSMLSPFDSQATRITVGAQLGMDVSVLLGDEARVGLLSPGAIIRHVVVLTGQLFNNEVDYYLTLRLPEVERWYKQAWAWLDLRTTECCRLVHEQVVPYRGMFKLEGTPRFADRMYGPPFHNWCRTVYVVLNEDEYRSL